MSAHPQQTFFFPPLAAGTAEPSSAANIEQQPLKPAAVALRAQDELSPPTAKPCKTSNANKSKKMAMGSRWLTVVADVQCSLKSIEALGFDPRRVRVIKAQGELEVKRIAWEALRNGTSDLVITSIGCLSESDLNKLVTAGHYGESRLMVLQDSQQTLH